MWRFLLRGFLSARACRAQHRPAVAKETDGNGASPGLSARWHLQRRQRRSVQLLHFGPINSNRETVSGLDFQVDYLHDLWDGSLSWHILGNYTDEKPEPRWA